MSTEVTEHNELLLAETPEDVAILYSWANLHGAKYRDFSASRREYRAQVRHRAAEDLRQSELRAKEEAEVAAADAERVARDAERAVLSAETYQTGVNRARALREADDAAQRAGAERVEAARRAEAAAIAEAVARREEREIAEAHASAQRQAASYTQSEARRRMLAGPQPAAIPALAGDPYQTLDRAAFDAESTAPFRAPVDPPRTPSRDESISPNPDERRGYRPEFEVRRRPQGYRPDDASGVHSAYGPPDSALAPVRSRISGPEDDLQRSLTAPYPPVDRPGFASYGSQPPSYGGERRSGDPRGSSGQESSAPAWLYESRAEIQPAPTQSSVVADTLQHSREQVASRWFALKSAFEPGAQPVVDSDAARQRETRPPVLAVFSLAGGVGKTSLVATLGRALSSLGEKVLLADTTSHGLLPYYFGASELKPGVVRTFSPPTGSTDAPIYLVSYDVDKGSREAAAQEQLADELARSASGTYRVLLDLNGNSGWMIRRLGRMSPTVLVPMSPDMNSVISLQTVERYFSGAVDADGRAILPFYVINQFDASLPLHLDVREVLRRQLGDRLLPFVVRRAPAVSEALAEGMTVIDYAPEAAIAEDYQNIAGWIRSIAAPRTQGIRNVRWSER